MKEYLHSNGRNYNLDLNLVSWNKQSDWLKNLKSTNPIQELNQVQTHFMTPAISQ